MRHSFTINNGHPYLRYTRFGCALLPKHTQRYVSDNGVTLKITPYKEETAAGYTLYLLVASIDGRTVREESGLRITAAVRVAHEILTGTPVNVGDDLTVWVNQGLRQGNVDAIKRTRVRVSYIMPNAGVVGGWWPIVCRNPHTQQAYICTDPAVEPREHTAMEDIIKLTLPRATRIVKGTTRTDRTEVPNSFLGYYENPENGWTEKDVAIDNAD